MSTYWYFECLDHDPPLRSEDEFTQHTDDEWFRQAVAMASNRPVEDIDDGYWRMLSVRFGGMDSEEDMSRAYFTGNARRFLLRHPHCRLGLVNEYGERRELREEKTNG